MPWLTRVGFRSDVCRREEAFGVDRLSCHTPPLSSIPLCHDAPQQHIITPSQHGLRSSTWPPGCQRLRLSLVSAVKEVGLVLSRAGHALSSRPQGAQWTVSTVSRTPYSAQKILGDALSTSVLLRGNRQPSDERSVIWQFRTFRSLGARRSGEYLSKSADRSAVPHQRVDSLLHPLR